MAAPGAGDPLEAKSSKAPLAQRIDPSRDKLTPAQLQFMRQVQLAQWQKALPQRRTRNVLTGLGIGALVLAIYGYTFYSVSQERFLDDLEEEAKLPEPVPWQGHQDPDPVEHCTLPTCWSP